MASRLPTTVKHKTPGSRHSRGVTNVMDFLQEHQELSMLMPTVTRLAAIQRDCAAAMNGLFDNCSVLRFESGQLVLSVPHAAIAARLKQKLPILQQSLAKVGWQVSAIKFKVQPGREPVWQNPPQKRGLSPEAVKAFVSLEQSLEKSPQNEALRSAIDTLVYRYRSKT